MAGDPKGSSDGSAARVARLRRCRQGFDSLGRADGLVSDARRLHGCSPGQSEGLHGGLGPAQGIETDDAVLDEHPRGTYLDPMQEPVRQAGWLQEALPLRTRYQETTSLAWSRWSRSRWCLWSRGPGGTRGRGSWSAAVMGGRQTCTLRPRGAPAAFWLGLYGGRPASRRGFYRRAPPAASRWAPPLRTLFGPPPLILLEEQGRLIKSKLWW